MTKKKLNIAVATVLAAVCGVAHAQTSPIRPAYSYPGTAAAPATGAASVQMGDTPLYFTPYIGAAIGHDDNLFLSNADKKKSDIYVVSPGFKIDARSPNSVIQLAWQSQLGRYVQSRDDDYVDHNFHAQSDTAFSGRTFLRLGWDYVRGHDPRGSTDRTISTTPDRYRLWAPSATFAFGAPGAQGRVELYYTDTHKTYLNNRAVTVQSDRDVTEYGGAFYWRVMPKTYLLAEVRQTDIAYDLPGSPFSGDERRYYAGVSWEATAATIGTLKVGQLKKTFNNDTLPDFSGTSWEAQVTWSPRTYSSFDFYTARTANESTGLGRFILSDIYGVTWNHSWNSVLSSAILARYQKDEYQGFDREDKVKSLGVRVGYKFRRWLTLGAEYTYTQRDSNASVFEYDKNFYLLTATASM